MVVVLVDSGGAGDINGYIIMMEVIGLVVAYNRGWGWRRLVVVVGG